MKLKDIFNHFIDLLYPNLCLVCDENLLQHEKQVCLLCINNFPKTNYHLQKNNLVEKRFWGKVKIERASSFLFFQKGSDFQKLIHELKYRGNQEVGVEMGKMSAVELLNSEEFMSVDLIVPVPLHFKKKAKRGYNQSDLLVKGMAEIMSKPYDLRNLYRKTESTTQTRKSVYERYENTRGIFGVRSPEKFNGKHILLVDDVLTTGSTLEACAQALAEECEDVKISVFTLAVAI
ncbi:MAG: ComF family protein [Porphyromonadaceae bacterium]|jgi:ComF family protein|nr:ComF family protein [Porphyromonadaceae bacterium]